MRKLLNRRPPAGLVVGFIALCVALGGGAFAATKAKKIEYKGLSKDARLKVLPVAATNAATGDCLLQVDNSDLNGTTIKVDAPQTTTNHGEGGGINIVTTPQGGKHTYAVACKETSGDFRVEQFQLTAATVR
jgi:hypothetical protein